MVAPKDSNMERLEIDYYEGAFDLDSKEHSVTLRFRNNHKAYNDFLNWLVLPKHLQTNEHISLMGTPVSVDETLDPGYIKLVTKTTEHIIQSPKKIFVTKDDIAKSHPPIPPTVFIVVEQSEGSIDDVHVFIDKEKAIEHSANWMIEFASDHYPDFLEWFEKYGHPEDDSVPFWTNCFPFNGDTAIDIFERTIDHGPCVNNLLDSCQNLHAKNNDCIGCMKQAPKRK